MMLQGYQDGSTTDAYAFYFVPINASWAGKKALINEGYYDWDFLWSLKTTGFPNPAGWFAVGAVPNFRTKLTSVIFAPGGSSPSATGFYITNPPYNFFQDKVTPTPFFVAPLEFNDAAIQTLFINSFVSTRKVQSTPYGFLFSLPNTRLFPNQQQNLILVSYDGKKCAAINMLPQTTAVFNRCNSTGYTSFCLDATGVLYCDSAAGPQIDISAALSIPWLPVSLSGIVQPSFLIPGLCGCDPRATMGIPDRSPITK